LTPAPRSPRQEIADATEHGEVYLRQLRRAQLQLSLLALVAFGAVFGVLPLALYLLPHLRHSTVVGIPIAIWIMVVPLSPLFIAIGWLYARRADALDEAFRDLVEK
jgi:putative solute:sodium symporter small subunit